MKKLLFVIYMILILIFIRLNAAEDTNRADVDTKKVLQRISPSVVKVVTENHRKYIATGVAVASDLVLSNLKVTGHPYERIYIVTVDGDTHDVTLIGEDMDSSLILLKTGKKVLKPAKKGKIPDTGEWVGLVGVFYKQFPFLNQGIISSSSGNDLILNATVAPGSTGGAVVNSRGELVGIIRGVFGYKFFPQYIFRENQSELKIVSSVRGGNDLCYALPVGLAMRISGDLRDFGRVKRGWLGVSISGIRDGHVVVDNVVKRSPAENAGIITGDIIIDVEGKEIRMPVHLSESIKMMRPGEKASISVKRGEKKLKLDVKIAELKMNNNELIRIREKEMQGKMERMPEFLESIPRIPDYTFEFSGPVSLGVDVLPLTPELAREFKVEKGMGLLISGLRDSPEVEKSGLKVGDILINVNGVDTAGLSDLEKSLSKIKPGDKVKMKLVRKGKILDVEIKTSEKGYKSRMLDEFGKKFSDAKFWMEKQQQLKMQEELEKLKALRMNEEKLKEQEKESLLKELKKRRLENLEKYKQEIERLIREKKAVEEELRKIKKKEDDPGGPSGRSM